MKKVFKRSLCCLLIVVLVAVCSVVLFACNDKRNDDPELHTYDTTTNIVDDNFRNYYEIFVWSFYDTNNDGIGDLNGVTQKLDYIKDMGFNGIWLMPIAKGTSYHKYDVEDYYNVDPQFGTNADLERLVSEAHARGINVILDLVVNHSSSQCNWFKQATDYIRRFGAPGGEYGDYYNFVKRSGSIPSGFCEVSGTDYLYEGRFWSGMPDLNLDSQNVKDEITNIMEFWLGKGVDGFRLDAVTSYYTGNHDRNVEFLSWLNRTAKSIKSDCYLVGEAWENNDGLIAKYYGSGCDSFFLFTGATADGSIANAMRTLRSDNGAYFSKLLLDLQETYPDGCILAPFLGNHDTARPGSFLISEERIKMGAGLMSMMNGSMFVYYGEEIGMISKDSSTSDPRKRIAMLWEDKNVYSGMCYTTPENIVVGKDSYKYPSVATQLNDNNSILNYYKHAVLIRNRFPEIARGRVEAFFDGYSKYVSVIRKTYNGESVVIVINLDSEYEQSFKVGKDALGFNTIVDELCVNASQRVRYNDETDTVVLPPYSIAIFK